MIVDLGLRLFVYSATGFLTLWAIAVVAWTARGNCRAAAQLWRRPDWRPLS